MEVDGRKRRRWLRKQLFAFELFQASYSFDEKLFPEGFKNEQGEIYSDKVK